MIRPVCFPCPIYLLGFIDGSAPLPLQRVAVATLRRIGEASDMALLESLDPEWGSLLEKAVQVALANPRGEWAMKDNRIFFVLPVSLSFVAMVFWLMQAATEFEPAPALVAPAGAQYWNPTSTSTPTPAPTPKLWYEAPPTPTMQVRWDGADATNKTIYLPYDPSQGHLLD